MFTNTGSSQHLALSSWFSFASVSTVAASYVPAVHCGCAVTTQLADHASNFGLAVRMVGYILLVVADHQHYSNTGTVIAGFVMQSIGYTWLITVSLNLYKRATDPDSNLLTMNNQNQSPKSSTEAMALRVLHIASIVALVLLIIGFNNVPSGLFEGQSGVKLPTTIKVADLLFCAITGILIALVLIALVAPISALGDSTPKSASQSRRTLLFILAALPFMSIRVAFVTWSMFRSSNPLRPNLVLKAILEYLTETIVVIIYFVLGAFFLSRSTARPNYENDFPVSGHPSEEPFVGSEQTHPPAYPPPRTNMYPPPKGSPYEVSGTPEGLEYKPF